MAGLCKATIIGNLGNDPETRFTPSGKSVCSFTVAANQGWGDNKVTEWFRVSTWGKLGEICQQYLGKGSKCYVEGRLRTRTWDGQDGQKRLEVEIVASDVQLLDSKRESGESVPSNPAWTEDAIPF